MSLFVCGNQRRRAQKWICRRFTQLETPALFHIDGREQMAPRNIKSTFLGPLEAGTERGEEVNLGLTLNSQPVIVGSLKQPAALELERGHSWVSRPQWSAEQWGKDVCRLQFLLTEAAPPHWHQSKLTAVLLLCSVVCSEPNGLRIQANKEPWHAYRSRKWEF